MTILSPKRILQTKITCKTSRICPRQRQWAKIRMVQKSTVPRPSFLSLFIRKRREVVLLYSARGCCQVKAKIVKLPWRPDYRQMYWTFGLKDGIWVVVPREWEDYPAEYLLSKAGWVYRTRAEAETALHAVAKEMGVEFIV